MKIIVNQVTYNIEEALLDKKLSSWLREDLGLTGTKIGCDIGVCGSCTVLVEGKPLRSCKLLLTDVIDKTVLTIEGITDGQGGIHPIQQAFMDAGAIQCGFCTAGMVLSAYALLSENPDPSRAEVRKAIKANLCRCTGYQQIIDAVMLAAEKMRKQ